MTNVTMKAVDQLHVSSVRPGSIQPGEEFEVSGHVADDLEKRGLAVRVGGDEAETKAEPAPENKMEVAPENKAEPVTAKPARATKPK